jgi:hypothetical protein
MNSAISPHGEGVTWDRTAVIVAQRNLKRVIRLDGPTRSLDSSR